MNCYYSNLIEGHDTYPLDIDRALHKDYSAEPKQCALQLEAVAHIEVQRAIDKGDEPADFPASSAYAVWLHREFCRRLPDELLWVLDQAYLRRTARWRSCSKAVIFHRRMEIYIEDETRAGRLPKGSFLLLREGLLAGEFERGQVDLRLEELLLR